MSRNSLVGSWPTKLYHLLLLLLLIWIIKLNLLPYLIVLKSGLGRLIWDPVDPELKPGRVEEKTGKEKIRSDSATRLTQQDLVATRQLLFFLLKRRHFDFFFKIDLVKIQ